MDGDEQNWCLDIWEDPLSMKLFTSSSLDINECTSTNVEREKKKVMQYHWHEDTLYFQHILVPKFEDKFLIMKKMHNEIGHFGEAKKFVEIKKWFF